MFCGRVRGKKTSQVLKNRGWSRNVKPPTKGGSASLGVGVAKTCSDSPDRDTELLNFIVKNPIHKREWDSSTAFLNLSPGTCKLSAEVCKNCCWLRELYESDLPRRFSGSVLMMT